MARITWQNVDAPDLGRAALILQGASRSIGEGGAALGGAARNAREDFRDRKSAAALPILAGIQSSGDVQGALSKISGMVRPEDMNEETRAAYLGLMDKGLGYDSKRATTRSVTDSNGRANTEFQRGIAREDMAADLAKPLQERKDAGRYGDKKAQYREGIASIESNGSGGYAAVGATDPNLGRALGKYQIMEANIPQWSKAALGREVSVEEFMENGDIQDAIFDHQFGGYVDKYGEENAARAWFGGPGAINNTGGTDVHGKFTIGDYGQKFVNQIGGQGVADLIPSNNVLPPSFYDEQGDDLFATEEEGYQRRRSRQADLDTDAAAAAVEAGRQLAAEAAGSVELAGDVTGRVADLARERKLPLDVQEAAIAALESPAIKSQFALESGDAVANSPLSTAANTSVTVFEGAVNDFAQTNETVRIQDNARAYSKDPAAVLTEKMGLTADDAGETTAAIEGLRDSAKAEGIDLSPSEAAALLYENIGPAGFSAALVPGWKKWGENYYDPEAALAMAKANMTTEQKQTGRETLVDVENANKAAESLKAEMSTVLEGLSVATSRGDEKTIEKWEKRRDLLEERAMSIQVDHGAFLPRAEIKPTTEDTKPAIVQALAGPDDALRNAALKVVDDALAVATDGGIDLEGLANASPEMQVRVLKTAIENLQLNGGSDTQINALEGLLEQAIRVDTKSTNNP